MMKVFIDTNVWIDWLLVREPFHADSTQVIQLSQDKAVLAHTTSISFANITYLLQGEVAKEKLRKILLDILSICAIIPTTERMLRNAVGSDFKDLEDAYQYSSAVDANLKAIITRNVKDYKQSSIPVYTPSELLEFLKKL